MSQTSKPIRVDIVSDVVCPWCVIGYYQLIAGARQARIELETHWHPFELNPSMVAGGENLREHLAAKYGTTPEGSRNARARLSAMGAALGFAFNYADDMRMYNTFLAHQLIDWAETQGFGHPVKLALFEAYFTHRSDVSQIDVLVETAGRVGLDKNDARNVLEAEERAANVRARQETWRARGISGVPAMIFDQKYLVTGAQGEDNYAEILKKVVSEKMTETVN